MKRTQQIIFLIAIAAAFASCDPYRFEMGDKDGVKGKILTPLSTVSTGQYSTSMLDSGLISIRNFGLTEYMFTFDAQLVSGEGMRIFLRPTVHERAVADSGVQLRVTTARSEIDTGYSWQKLSNAHLSLLQSIPVTIYSANHLYQVTLGCDTLIKSNSAKPESDYVLLGALKGSVIRITNPEWKLLTVY